MIEHKDKIIEAALFSAPEPLSVDKIAELFPEESRPVMPRFENS